MSSISISMSYVWLFFLVITAIMNAFGVVWGYLQSAKHKNAFGLTPWLYPWGVFVWGDALVISPFFILVSLLSLIVNDLNLFMLFFSAYWLIRSIGESIYWFNQQFSTIVRVKLTEIPFYGKLVHDDSAWFVMQIFMQCIAVFALIGTIYFAAAWLK